MTWLGYQRGWDREEPPAAPSALGAVPRPEGYRGDLVPRARECVKLAATMTETAYLASWFRQDERGVWEAEALRLLVRCETDKAEAIAALGLTPERVNEQVANALILLGLEALILNEKRRR